MTKPESDKISLKRSSLGRILGYLKPHKLQFIAALGCMVVFGASDGVIPFLVKEVLDGVFTKQDRSLLMLLPVLLIGLALVRASADFGQQFLMSRVGLNVIKDIRNSLNRHLLNLSADYFVKNSSGNLLTIINNDVLLVRGLLTDSVAAVIRDSIRVVVLLIAAVYLDPMLAALAVVLFPIGIYPVHLFGKKIRSLSRRGQEATGALASMLQESILGNRVVKIFSREKFEQERFEERNESLTKTFVKSERARAITGPINEVLASIAIAGVIWYGGWSVMSGARSQGDFIAFLLAVFLLYDPFKKLGRVHSAVQQGLSGVDRILSVMDTPAGIIEPRVPVALGQSNSVEFVNVTFSYDPAKPPALSDISLIVPEGKKVALVGFSGAGKSTLIDLVPRFIDPTVGQVKVGGVDIRDVSLAELRGRVALVGQHTFLFNDTIYNNIAYGNMAATKEQVLEAARTAYAYDFISALPDGFESKIGEAGLTLSGGERQRVAIARAVLKDAPILILDEATASLDNRSEREVQAALAALEKNRTSIVIAHRLSTVQDADLIVVLHEGRIVEVGTHRELLNQGGEYAKLYALQFRNQIAPSEEVIIN